MNREEMKHVAELADAICDAADKIRAIAQPGAKPVPAAKAVNESASRPKTGFVFSQKSLRELQGVNSLLVKCVTNALLYYTTQDFMVFDGLRTEEEQRELVRRGASRTMNSKHLVGRAVDLVPIIGGVPKWDWTGCAKIAFAMDQAATELDIAHRITWGGAWDRTLADFGGSPDAYMEEVAAYRARTGKGFIDGPHFEISL